MSISEACDAEKITSLVKQHVPKAKLSRQHEAELTFTLPFESMDTFPGSIHRNVRRSHLKKNHDTSRPYRGFLCACLFFEH